MVCEVLVEISAKNIDKTFTYRIPEKLNKSIMVGQRVLVPFGPRKIEGFVLNIIDYMELSYSLKDVIEVIDDEPVLNDELLELGKFISRKTLCNLITCYQMMLPKALKARNGVVVSKKYISYLKLNECYENIVSKIKNPKQLQIVNMLKEGELEKKLCNDVSVSSVKTLLEYGYIVEIKKEKYRLDCKSTTENIKPKLTTEQENAIMEINNSLDSFQPFLLHGVTGSGKTEVYMNVIENVLSRGKEALVLVPEISLTPQFVSNFTRRFGDKIAILHSGLSDGEKYDEWRKIIRKEVSIVIGARSASFAPLTNLGIIIVDEEHSSTYKQENNPRYNALDVCLYRAKKYDIPVVFGSATPSIESYTRTKENIYKLIELKHRVFTTLPKVKLVDMKNEIRKGNKVLCEDLIKKLNDCILHNKQAIILLNRRGFSTVLTCNSCGYTSKCPYCDIPLTFHKSTNSLRCHYCGYTTKKIEICPECNGKDITYLGMGTEKLEEWIRINIMGARTLRMDVDTTARKGSLNKIIDSFKNKEFNVLIGTQMIAKGLDFSDVTLVGVVSGDASLNIPDFRSAERTFDLLNQVAGRAGRGTEPGEVIIQGFNIEHYSIVCASNHNYHEFYEEEMKIRKKLKYPPYCNICLLKLSGKEQSTLFEEANKIVKYLSNLSKIIILGPSSANIPKVNNIYYVNVIIKYKKSTDIIEQIKFLKNKYNLNNKVNLDIDFNPNQI